jgi:hypothetical protein
LWLNQVTSLQASPFHAVEIRCAKDACRAAKDTRGERYLSAEAPLLPLDQCDRRDRCRCGYKHYEDRRTGSRRRAEVDLTTQSDSERAERRLGKGRRVEDIAEDADEPSSLLEDTYYSGVVKQIRDPSDSA